jgi:hypothetical protein
MAFDITNLSPVGGNSRRGKAPQMFTYATLDTHATVDSNQYFNGGSSTPYGGAYNMLDIGDVIFVVVWSTAIGTGGTLSTYGTHIVKDKASGAIDTTDVTVGTVTDTD